eukprot:1161137-Pelagomonas_calceolata.AAC.6
MGAGHAAAGPVTRSRIQQISGLGASVLNALQEGVSRLQASHNSTQCNGLGSTVFCFAECVVKLQEPGFNKGFVKVEVPGALCKCKEKVDSALLASQYLQVGLMEVLNKATLPLDGQRDLERETTVNSVMPTTYHKGAFILCAETRKASLLELLHH